jgi:LmbE family N-acetylglucosaminyl deacetylase
MINKNTLYIGAHPDDIAIGASVQISRDPEHSFILTISGGVSPTHETPIRLYDLRFNSIQEYKTARINEDKTMVNLLGVNPDRYFNGDVSDGLTYLYLNDIMDIINKIVRKNNIQRIFSHTIPESHPDHEVVSFCSNFIGINYDIPVWEFPLYVIGHNGEMIDLNFLEQLPEDNIINLTEQEFELKQKVLENYLTQQFIRKRFGRRNIEVFRLSKLDLTNIPKSTGYFYGFKDGLPHPNDVRSSFKKFLVES